MKVVFYLKALTKWVSVFIFIKNIRKKFNFNF